MRQSTLVWVPSLPLDEEAIEWAKIASYATILRVEKPDLDDEVDVWRALFRHGVGPGDAMKYAPDAIRRVREQQQDAVNVHPHTSQEIAQ